MLRWIRQGSIHALLLDSDFFETRCAAASFEQVKHPFLMTHRSLELQIYGETAAINGSFTLGFHLKDGIVPFLPQCFCEFLYISDRVFFCLAGYSAGLA